jgi:hypothetical protein
VLGIAVLAAVFSARGGYATPSAFVDGFVPALPDRRDHGHGRRCRRVADPGAAPQ